MDGDRTLRATLFEIERGLFRINYRAEMLPAERSLLPPFQLAATVADARRLIEEQARRFGFEVILWDTDGSDPADPRLPLAPDRG